MSYLMVIGIGPVQEFITTARRSRDLWFGSWLLSELSKAAARRIVEEHDDDLNCLIFPRPETPGDLNAGSAINVVNKIVALIEKPPSEIGKAAFESISARLKAIRDKAFREIEDTDNYFYRGVAEEQVNDLIEYFWASATLDDPTDEAKYTEARDLAEALLAARRATRDFKPVLPQPAGWAANVPKSSLDGLRESVIDERAFGISAAQLRVQYGVRKGERLCGVGLLKRHGNRAGDDSFFSTSHLAALPLLQSLDDQQAVTDYIHALTALLVIVEKKELRKVFGKIPARAAHPAFLDYDGHLLFEERLSEFFEGPNLEQAKQALTRFLDRAFGGKQPNPYYGLILADGDHMGRTIDEQRDIKRHRQLSRQLTTFAKSAQLIVERDHQGSLVYAGGDDVLAFLPLHMVLPCARALAERFNSQMSAFPVREGDEGSQLTPTLSVGIAISHHIEPLSDALQLARQAEKAAKSVIGKKALAVTFRKRSGTDRTVKGRWGDLDQRLDRFVLLHRAEAIPDGAAYELRDLDVRLEGVKREVLEAEAMRILRRKRVEQGQRPMAERVLSELNQSINDPDLSLKQLADELIIARELARATRQAGIEPEMLPGALAPEEPAEAEQEHKQ